MGSSGGPTDTTPGGDTRATARRSMLATIDARRAALTSFRLQAVAPLSVEQTTAEAVALATRTLHAELGAVAKCVDGQEALLVCAGLGWNAGVVGHTRMNAGPGTLGGFVLEHRCAVVVEDLARFGDFALDPVLTDHRAVSALVVPIRGRTGVSGLLGVYSAVRRLFSPLDLEFAQEVAGVIRGAEYRDRLRQGSA